MYLVDTSVWINHLIQADAQLNEALKNNSVCSHSHVIGEMSLGSIKDRTTFLHRLSRLPQVRTVREEEVIAMINQNALFSRGIGYVDAHLLAACLIDGKAKIWTHDRRFNTVATELGVAAYPVN